MIGGTFFTPQQGIRSFDTFLYEKVAHKGGVQFSIDYPISLVLREGRIAFYFHGYRYFGDERKRTENNQSAKEDKGERHYGVSRIFELSFSEGSGIETEETLRRMARPAGAYEHEGLIDTGIYDKQIYSPFPKNILPGGERFENNKLYGFELFLDFLYDFFHTNAFVSHPAYRPLRRMLLDHPFIRAIILKVQFYYYLKRLKEISRESAQQEKDKLGKDFENAAKKWLTFLRSEDGNEIVKPENHWFDGVEAEHMNIYEKTKDLNRTRIESSYPKENRLRKKISGNRLRFLRKEAEESIEWLLSRYNISAAFRLQFGWIFSRSSNWAVGVFMVIVLMVFFWSVAQFHVPERFSFPSTNFLFWTGTCLSSLFFLFLIALILERFGYGLLSITESVLQYLKPNNPYLTSRTFSQYLLSIPKIVNFFKPRILVASLSVWTLLFASHWVWQFTFHINTFWGIFIATLSAIMIFFMFAKFSNFIKVYKSINKLGRLLVRTLLIFILAFIYSFIIGAVIMAGTAEQVLKKNNFLQEYFLSLKEYEPSIRQFQPGYKYIDTVDWVSLDAILEIKYEEPTVMEDTSLYTQMQKVRQALSPKKSKDALLLEYLNRLSCAASGAAHQAAFVYSLPQTQNKMHTANGVPATVPPEFSGKKLILLPEILVFYSFICLAAGIFIELAWKEKL